MNYDLVDPSKKTVKVLFSDSQHIAIPRYQRPFSWDVDDADKFYHDIFKEGDSYFLGSILLNKKDGVYEVIDGQQRITTISLLYLSLYLYYKSIDNSNEAEHIFRLLKKGGFGQKTNVLVLNKINNEFYSKLINLDSVDMLDGLASTSESSENESNKNLLKIVRFFINEIKTKKVADINLEKQRVQKLFNQLSDNVFFIAIITPNTEQASKLFEVLNNRGTDLTEADLIRNYLLSKSEEQKFDDCINTWEILEKQVGIDNLEQFLRYSSLLISTKDTTYERIIEYTDANSSKTVIDYLYGQVSFYMQLIDPSSFSENTEDNYLEDLNIFGVTQIRSILLAANSKLDKTQLPTLMSNLVNLIFRYSVICGKNPNKIELLAKDLSYNIFCGKYSPTDVMNKVKSLDPDDDEFQKNFKSKKFKNTKIPRYIIEKIESKISVGDKSVELGAVHLEHIMPKKLEKWQADDNYYTDEFHEQYVDNIGNMVLLHKGINTKIKNNIFSAKKTEYKGDINLIGDIQKRKTWKKEDIEWNMNRYYETAKNIWSKLI